MHIHTNDFNLTYTLEAGQCFEWKRYKKGYAGILNEIFLYIYQEQDTLFIQAHEAVEGRVEEISEEKYPKRAKAIIDALHHYFSLDAPYKEILSAITVDGFMTRAIQKYHGLRVVKQPHFDCFISFLLSANTTVKNTKMARDLISKDYGKHIYTTPDTNESFYALPPIDVFQTLSEKQLRECKAGFRAAYIHQAVQNISYTQLEQLNHMTYEEAKSYLIRYKGIGEKIADCILLYSYDFENIYPTDTWVKQFTQQLYFPHKKVTEKEIRNFGLHYFNGYAGWAQLFLYIASRENGIASL